VQQNIPHHEDSDSDGNRVAAWLLACVVACILGTSHYLDDWHSAFGPDDVATAQLVANDLAEVQQRAASRHRREDDAVHLGCGPRGKGKRVPGTNDIQCLDADGKPDFYAGGALP
jgi:hypothetical protein